MEHLNNQEKFNLNEVEEHTDKKVEFFSKNYVVKLSCWGALNIEINSRIYICMYHYLVYVGSMYGEIN